MIFAAKYPQGIHLQIMAVPLVGHSSRVSAHAWAERWKDRQTDAQQFHRPCSACYVSSANNMVQKVSQNFMQYLRTKWLQHSLQYRRSIATLTTLVTGHYHISKPSSVIHRS